jgi:hypothetical protein
MNIQKPNAGMKEKKGTSNSYYVVLCFICKFVSHNVKRFVELNSESNITMGSPVISRMYQYFQDIISQS